MSGCPRAPRSPCGRKLLRTMTETNPYKVEVSEAAAPKVPVPLLSGSLSALSAAATAAQKFPCCFCRQLSLLARLPLPPPPSLAVCQERTRHLHRPMQAANRQGGPAAWKPPHVWRGRDLQVAALVSEAGGQPQVPCQLWPASSSIPAGCADAAKIPRQPSSLHAMLQGLHHKTGAEQHAGQD